MYLLGRSWLRIMYCCSEYLTPDRECFQRKNILNKHSQGKGFSEPNCVTTLDLLSAEYI